MRYASVNGQWPEGTRDGRDLKPTPQEAVAAVRRLWRFGTGKAWRGKIVVTSGRRRGGVRYGVITVNPDRWAGGWHEVVHMISHHVAFRLHPGIAAHSTQHAFIERTMIAHVVESGWLEGKLRRPEKPKPDRAALKAARLAARIVAWERKQRRAEAALRKLKAVAKRAEGRRAISRRLAPLRAASAPTICDGRRRHPPAPETASIVS